MTFLRGGSRDSGRSPNERRGDKDGNRGRERRRRCAIRLKMRSIRSKKDEKFMIERIDSEQTILSAEAADPSASDCQVDSV